MVYDAFLEQITFLVKEQAGKDADVQVVRFLKTNGVYKEGILIRYPNQNITPTIYLEELYEQVNSGRSLNSAAREVVRLSKKEIPFPLNLEEDIMSFEACSTKILPRLINTSRNIELLEDVPHIPVLDLSITFYILIYNGDSTMSTTMIHNSLCEAWGIKTADLFAQAMANTQTSLPVLCESLLETLYELDPAAEHLPNPDDAVPLNLITTPSGLFGSFNMLQKDVLKNFADSVGDDLMIIPSSIHEVLAAPINCSPTVDEYNDMIQDVNEEAVTPTDQLSDHVYIYRREGNYITIPYNESIRFYVDTLFSE